MRCGCSDGLASSWWAWSTCHMHEVKTSSFFFCTSELTRRNNSFKTLSLNKSFEKISFCLGILVEVSTAYWCELKNPTTSVSIYLLNFVILVSLKKLFISTYLLTSILFMILKTLSNKMNWVLSNKLYGVFNIERIVNRKI